MSRVAGLAFRYRERTRAFEIFEVVDVQPVTGNVLYSHGVTVFEQTVEQFGYAQLLIISLFLELRHGLTQHRAALAGYPQQANPAARVAAAPSGWRPCHAG